MYKRQLYKTPIPLDEDATVYSAVYRDGKPLGKVTRKSFAVNKATAVSYTHLDVYKRQFMNGLPRMEKHW